MAEISFSKRMMDFIVASYAPKVIALLKDDQTVRPVLSNAVGDMISIYPKPEEMKGFDSKKLLMIEREIMQAFIRAIYPAELKVNEVTARFICKAYLEHRHNGKPILAEDFYKIADNLRYFEGLKNKGILKAQNINADLNTYKSYQELLDVLKPFEEKRMAKEAEDAFRKLTPEQKHIIQSETTILYDGIEGQVVIPHTPRASQFWGSNTKWCIAGTGKYDDGTVYADKHFPDYNQKSPIVVIIPKGMQDQKIALVEQTVWDAEDKKVTALPEAHFELFQKCSPHIALTSRAILRRSSNPHR